MSQAKRVSLTESPTNKGGAATNNAAEASVPVLSFPSTVELPNLSSLTDKRSPYASVARTCLQLNQFAGSGSSAAASDDSNNNALFHDASFAKTISAAHAALIECAQTHEDRRCRILACKTLALVARSAYARLRHTPLLFGVREATLHRLEDEVGTDVPVALCSVALEDVDDGVSACAVEALGMLTLSNAGMVGTSVEDSLLREIEAIAHARPSPHAPTLMLLEDDDFSIPQLELQCRVYENVLSPRLWRLVRRILHFHSVSQFMKSLPFLTACLRHLCTHTTSFGMDRSEYSKRWVEIDAPAMVDEVVSSLLLPAMQQNDAGLAHCASLCTLRLADALPNASWIPQACPWAVSVLIDEVVACEMLQQKMTMLSTLLIALRPLVLSERTPTLAFVANEVRFLPCTTRVPSGVVSPGMKSPKDGSYRRPARIGFLSEIALSFFVDDDNDDGIKDGNVRSTALKKFLSSAEVTAMLTARSDKKSNKSRIGSNQTVASVSSGDGLSGSNAPGGKTPTEEYAGSHVGEELVLAFCKVASKTGKQVMMPRGGRYRSSRDLEDWLRCSLAVLSAFSACVNWRSRTTDASLNEEDHDVQTLFTLLAAAQGSYIGLLQECIYTVGLLSPASSVSLHVMPLAVPPDLTLLEEMSQNTVALTGFEPVGGVDFAHSDLVTLVDQLLEYKLREGVASRHVRISLLALLTDHWVQSSHHTTGGVTHDADEPAAIHINELNAREILANLSQEISSLSREINEAQEEGQEFPNVEVNEQYLRVCVASVENMALTACDWMRRFGASNANLDEDARYIISLALAALEGKNLRDGDTASDSKPATLDICAEAIKRVHDVAGADHAMQADAFGVGGEAPALYSSLVAGARLDVKSGIEYAPYLSTSSVSLPRDASTHAHLAQYCQQVIGSRFELAIWSSPLADADDAEANPTQSRLAAEIMDDGQDIATPSAIRLWNPLRLAAPPPPSRRPKVVWGPGARMCWSGSTSMVTAGSDPVAVVLAYVARRMPRYDCEPEYHIDVTMKIHNITAVEIAKGVRLGLSVTQKQCTSASETSEEPNEPDSDIELFSTASVYKQELNAGEHLMWEVSLPHIAATGVITLIPSIAFRETDGDQSMLKWVGKNGDGSDNSTEDTNKASEKAAAQEAFGDDNILDVSLSCESVTLSSMANLQPDPLVFFRNTQGDESVFRFLWLQLPYHSTPKRLVPNVNVDTPRQKDELADAVSNLSSVALQDRVRTSEAKVERWAFTTLSGDRLFCVVVSTAEEAELQLRSDDQDLLHSLMGSKSTQADVLAALTSNHWQYKGPTTEHPDDTAMTVSF